MSENGRGPEEVRKYVRNRMSGDLPPGFVEDVMSEVRHTPQRGSGWAGWRLAAVLGTVAAAVAVVGIGLSMVDRGGVGSGSPTPGASASPVPTGTSSPSPAPSTSPTGAPGPYGAVWSLAPQEAFPDPVACENRATMPTLEYGDNVGFRVWMPGDWFTAESYLGECFWFAPEPWPDAGNLEASDVPEEVEIVIAVASGGDFAPGGEVSALEKFTVDGVPALRYEIQPEEGGELAEPSVVWVIGVTGELPSDAIDAPPFLTLTASGQAGALIQVAEVLDRMVATLEILPP
jgi:hypothetical protein